MPTLEVDGFVAVNDQPIAEKTETSTIDIGNEAVVGDSVGSIYSKTHINTLNPANDTGTITSIEIYAKEELSGVVVATFYQEDALNFPTHFTARDSYSISGTIATDSKKTISVDLSVVEGDYIGIYYSGGRIHSTISSNYKQYYASGDQTACENTEFTLSTPGTSDFSLKGIGESVNVTPAYYTHIEIGGTLLVDDGADYWGLRLPGSLSVLRNLVNAMTNTVQGIRISVTIGGVDVTSAITGGIQVVHNLNYISSFSFTLSDPDYSPKVNSNIDIDKVVVITAYVNGQEVKMFTGLVDELRSSNSPGGYRLNIRGRDYGKKLLNTTKTLISIQDRANTAYRGSMVEYLARQANITNVVIPTGDSVTIDHSFQDQTIWDMIQKECVIQGWYVRFDENAKMICRTKSLKSSGSEDWTYGENKFTEVGLTNNDEGIINKVIILGAIFEETEITVETTEGTPNEVITNPTTYETGTSSFSKSFADGESVTAWSDSNADFSISTRYVGAITTELNIGALPTAQTYSFDITKLNSDLTVTDVTYTVTGDGVINYQSNSRCQVARDIEWGLGLSYAQEKAFSISITINTKEQTGGGIEEIEGTAPNETFTETITYEQVKATVIDSASIAEYGERKPNNEGTLNFPLAETTAQCQRIGENIIKDSHRFTEQPDFVVPFNPKLVVGQTVNMTDTKIGYSSDRYLVEEVIHYIDISRDGKIKARTRIGCVYYT